MDNNAKSKRTLKATVVSTAMDKTAVAVVDRHVENSLGKRIRKTTRLHVHDPANVCKNGDVISVVQVAPMSKTKRWLLEEVLVAATQVEG